MAGIVYLKLTAKSQGVIEGKSVNPDFSRENAIECTSFRINITKPHDRNTGLSTGRRYYEPITFVKDIDQREDVLRMVMSGDMPQQISASAEDDGT